MRIGKPWKNSDTTFVEGKSATAEADPLHEDLTIFIIVAVMVFLFLSFFNNTVYTSEFFILIRRPSHRPDLFPTT